MNNQKKMHAIYHMTKYKIKKPKEKMHAIYQMIPCTGENCASKTQAVCVGSGWKQRKATRISYERERWSWEKWEMKVGNEVRSKMKKLKKRKENITLMKKILHESKKNKGKREGEGECEREEEG